MPAGFIYAVNRTKPESVWKIPCPDITGLAGEHFPSTNPGFTQTHTRIPRPAR